MRTSRVTESRAAFTMVELLVSMAILALLVTMLAGVFSQVSRAWITGEGGVERRRSARAITDFITTELRCAVAPVDRVSTTGRSNLQLLINPPANIVPAEYANADTLFWQAPVATETTYGDLAEIGYFVRWNETVPGRPRPSLCRFFVNPSVSNASGDGNPVEPNPNFLIYRVPTWLNGELIEKVAPATAPGFRGLFADNVAGFWVRAFQPDGAELLTDGKKGYDSRVGYRFKVANGTTQERFLPARIQISFAQLDSPAVVHLDRLSENVQALARQEGVRDAGTFLAALQDAARDRPELARLLPGLRIFTTEVRLENSR